MKSPEQLETLRRRTFYGREKDNAIYPIALANLVLHDIDEPHIWHGNSLTGGETYDGLFAGAPELYDVILMNPPFGGKEGKEASTRFAYKTRATQVLFLQHVVDSLKPSGRCGIVLDEGLLFRTNETAFVQTKRKLLDDCDLWCIVSLPGGVFTSAGAGVKTNILFFNKGGPTETIWYYDLSHVKVGKRTPLTISHFDDFLRLLPKREEGERSWTVDIAARRREAKTKADKLRAQAQRVLLEAKGIQDRIAQLKEAKSPRKSEIAELEAQAGPLLKQGREQRNRAQATEDAAFDLKAVNPHQRANEDTRTPAELLEFIEAKGKEVAEALAALRRG